MCLKDRQEFLPGDSMKDQYFFFPGFIFFISVEGLETAAGNMEMKVLKTFIP